MIEFLATAIHGDRSQLQRDTALRGKFKICKFVYLCLDFENGRIQILVATDVAGM